MKVGFQGDWGSNSEFAARKLLENFNKEVEFIPLISSLNVVNALKNGEISYGIMAIKNNIGGVVSETQQALDLSLIKISEIEMRINHCVFVKNKHIKADDIKFIASHEQALKQSQANLNKIFAGVDFVKIDDTALGAKYLSDGTFGDDYAVVCSKQAGISNNLYLFYSNVEDRESITTFGLFERR